MADAAGLSAGDDARRFLTFRIAEQLYALPAAEVVEVIRMPAVARVPQGPKSLLGLGNLRGEVLPVASGPGLLGRDTALAGDARAIVLSGPAPVALAVDAVSALVTVDESAIETRQAELATEPGEQLRGAFAVAGAGGVAKILDVWPMLQAAFVQAPRAPRAHGAGVQDRDDIAVQAADDRERLVTFEVAGQEFALPLDAVQEIVPMPDALAAVPRAEAVVLGVAAHRDTLLPVLSLRTLLGFPSAPWDGREKVLVTRVRGVLVGLVADRMRAIVSAEPELVEPTPPMLAARTGGESRIKAIYRGDGGRRLISILATEQLFREDVMQRLGETAAGPAAPEAGDAAETLRFLVFRLGEDEFALPIEVVDEVARAPDQVTRVPKTPKFLEGVVNLRGDVLPVVDQRRRFDMPPAPDREARRLIVVRTERHRAGLIVDSVSEVLRSAPDAIGPAPDLTGNSNRLVRGVINLDAQGRIVLLLDPAELLTRAERGLLDTFQADTAQAS